jgi:hypothetical protein
MHEESKASLRNELLPLLERGELSRMIGKLKRDDVRLTQGRTFVKENGALYGGCFVGLLLIWRGARSDWDVDVGFSEFVTPGMTPFIHWFDETRRDVMRRKLLLELLLHVEKEK